MSVDILKLKAAAEAATSGQWVTDGEYINEHGNVLYAYVAHENSGRIAEAFANCLVKTDEQCRANAHFIATANPPTVLALIAEIERHRQVDAEGCKPDLNILPCPFCGGMANSRCSAGPDPDWWVECTECEASAPIFSEEKPGGWNNRTQPAMSLDLSIIAQAMGFEPGEQPGEEGIAIAIRVLRTQLAYLGKHLWDLQEYFELSSSVRKKVEAAISGAADPRKLSTAACDVLSERLRQEEVEGWHPDGDDAHTACEMAVAGGLYALYSGCYPTGEPPKGWPWDPSWWKPKDYRTDLVRAGALILAEIERLDRMPQNEVQP